MKKSIRNSLVVLLVMALMLGTFNINVSASKPSPIRIMIEGKEVKFSDAHPFSDENNRVQVPLRAVLEAYGASVGYNDVTKTVSVHIVREESEWGYEYLTIPIEAYYFYNAGIRTIVMDTKSVIVDNRMYLPIRPIIEALGGSVTWDGSTRTVHISYEPTPEPKPTPRPTPPPTVSSEASEEILERISFTNDPKLFMVYAFMNATGHDFENYTEFHPLRKAVRDDIKSMNLKLSKPNYFKDKGISDMEYATISSFLNDDYPFKWKMDNSQVILSTLNDFPEAFNDFFNKVGGFDLYDKYADQIEDLIEEEFRLIGDYYINESINKFNLSGSDLENEVEFKINYLDTYWRGYNLQRSSKISNPGKEVMIVTGNPDGNQMMTVIHELMHSFSIPVVYQSDLVFTLAYELNKRFENTSGYQDWMTVIDECFVRALSADVVLADGNKKYQHLTSEVNSGFIMTQFIVDRIKYFEEDKLSFSEFVEVVTQEYLEYIAGTNVDIIENDISLIVKQKFDIDLTNDREVEKGTIVDLGTITTNNRQLFFEIYGPDDQLDIFKENMDLINEIHKKTQEGYVKYSMWDSTGRIKYTFLQFVAETLIGGGVSHNNFEIRSFNHDLPSDTYTFYIQDLPVTYGDYFLNGIYKLTIIVK